MKKKATATHQTFAIIKDHPAGPVRRAIYTGSEKTCNQAARNNPRQTFEDWQGKLTLCEVSYEVAPIS